MTDRNLSMVDYFIRKAGENVSRLSFTDEWVGRFDEWKAALKKELKTLLGPFPRPVDLNPEIISETRTEGLIKRRVLLDLEKDMSVVAWLYIPESALNKPAPAILCNHGHGRFGKDSVMGVTSGCDPRRREEIEQFNYDYGLQMARRGYVTLAIDWRVFGERGDNSDPYMPDDKYPYPGRDKCNVHFIRGSVMGMNLLALNIFDAGRCIDYLCGLDCVDTDRIGAMGLSFGGTMTMWISLLDDRIRAADIICYSCCFADYAVRNGNFCGSQYVPGLFNLCDVPDIQGAIAPKPLLAEIGVHDKCFRVEDSLKCSRRVREIYAAAGAENNYDVDLFEGDHQFAGIKAFGFFDKHLKDVQ